MTCAKKNFRAIALLGMILNSLGFQLYIIGYELQNVGIIDK
ncbi:MAG: hypothetical protein ACFCAD_11275 [Pleurocapsa sp.]